MSNVTDEVTITYSVRTAAATVSVGEFVSLSDLSDVMQMTDSAVISFSPAYAETLAISDQPGPVFTTPIILDDPNNNLTDEYISVFNRVPQIQSSNFTDAITGLEYGKNIVDSSGDAQFTDALSKSSGRVISDPGTYDFTDTKTYSLTKVEASDGSDANLTDGETYHLDKPINENDLAINDDRIVVFNKVLV